MSPTEGRTEKRLLLSVPLELEDPTVPNVRPQKTLALSVHAS
jgi:hypothetical protein